MKKEIATKSLVVFMCSLIIAHYFYVVKVTVYTINKIDSIDKKITITKNESDRNLSWAGYYHTLVNIKYYELLINGGDDTNHSKALLARWVSLRDMWKQIYDDHIEISKEREEELYYQRWSIEQSELKPNYKLLMKAQLDINKELGY